jgi:hypothetical protein
VVKRRRAEDDHFTMGLRRPVAPLAALLVRCARLRRATLAVVAVALCGCGQAGAVKGFGPEPTPTPAATAAAPEPSPSPLEETLVAGDGPELPLSLAIGHLRRDTERREAFEIWRLAELEKAKRSPTVAGALRRALLARHISQREHDRLRRGYASARAALGRLTGLRRAELAAVVGHVDALAASHRLTAGRFEPVFLVLRRNREFWTRSETLPAAGHRTSFARDPAVFQYYPGQGMQLQQLASWGRVNARLRLCRRGGRCPRGRLRRSLNRLVSLGSRRDRFLAWESYFSFGGGTPPWISGMTQGTAVQALARGARVLREARYVRTAERALGAFRAPPPVGVGVDAPGGRHYLMYSFSPGLRILNGDLQAITGLRDLAKLGGSRRAFVLYRRGERAARRAVGDFDTGAWSLYSESGRESTLGYHQLVGQFLGNLCDRTRGRTYCSAQRRFARYEREPPRIQLAALRGLHARRAASVRFNLSKVSTVAVRVSGARGVSLSQRLALPRGSHAVTWVPPRRGAYRVRIEAQGPSGPRGVRAETVRVVLPKPKPKPKKKPRDKGSRGGAQPASTPGISPLRKASTKRR